MTAFNSSALDARADAYQGAINHLLHAIRAAEDEDRLTEAKAVIAAVRRVVDAVQADLTLEVVSSVYLEPLLRAERAEVIL